MSLGGRGLAFTLSWINMFGNSNSAHLTSLCAKKRGEPLTTTFFTWSEWKEKLPLKGAEAQANCLLTAQQPPSRGCQLNLSLEECLWETNPSFSWQSHWKGPKKGEKSTHTQKKTVFRSNVPLVSFGSKTLSHLFMHLLDAHQKKKKRNFSIFWALWGLVIIGFCGTKLLECIFMHSHAFVPIDHLRCQGLRSGHFVLFSQKSPEGWKVLEMNWNPSSHRHTHIDIKITSGLVSFYFISLSTKVNLVTIGHFNWLCYGSDNNVESEKKQEGHIWS